MKPKALAVSLIATCVLAAPTPDPFIEAARKTVAAYQASLPDYIVTRKITRYKGARMDFWHTVDTVSATVVTQHGKEVYSKIVLNGKPAEELPGLGAWSVGEFSAALMTILPPERAAVFTHQHAEQLRGRPSYRYDFSVDRPHSAWHLADDTLSRMPSPQTYAPAYRGAVWIDKQTAQVLRFEMSARALPPWFALSSANSQTDFDFVQIGDRNYMLPIHSVALTCEKHAAVCLKNETVFTDYRKFTASETITFDGTGK